MTERSSDPGSSHRNPVIDVVREPDNSFETVLAESGGTTHATTSGRRKW